MLSPTHLAAGYVVVSRIVNTEKIATAHTTRNRTILLIWGLVLSVGMDLDFTNIADHHRTLMHYPLFWLTLCGLLFIGGRVLRNDFLASFASITFITAMLHLILDTFGVTLGIYWLYPFSDREFSFLTLHPPIPDFGEWLRFYIRQPIMLVEILIVAIGIAKWLLDRKRQKEISVS